MTKKLSTEPLSIKQNFFWNSFGSIIYQGCMWLTTVLVVVLSNGYENSGVFAYAMSIGNLFNPLALYGTRTIQVSDLKNKYSQPNYVTFRVITTSMSFTIFAVYTLVTTIYSPEIIAVCIAFLLFKSDEAFSIVCFACEQKCDRMDYIGRSLIVRGVLCVASFSAALFLTGNLFVAVLSMFILCVGVTLFYDVPHARLFGSVSLDITKAKTVALLKECLPAVASAILCNAVISLSRQIFGITYSEDALGIYAAVATPAVLVQTLATFLYNPLLTTIAKKWYGESAQAFSVYLIKNFLLMLLVLVVSVVVLAFIGPFFLIFVYGASIEGYVYLFTGVLIISGMVAIMWFTTDVLIVLRSYRSALWMNAISFVVSILLIKPLIDSLYMNGINLDIIVSYAVGVVVGLVFLLRKIQQKRKLEMGPNED